MRKLLISAFAFSPIRGSECAVGWEIVVGLTKYFDITVLICKETASGKPFYNETMEYLADKNLDVNLNIVPIEIPKSSSIYYKLHDNGFWPAFYWAYKEWQKSAYNIAKELNQTIKFDATYQLNLIGYREPGYLWKLGLPHFWGPTNGFHSIPFAFLITFNTKQFILQSFKHVANQMQVYFSLRSKKAAKIAKIVWCVDQIAVNRLKKWGATTVLLQETGMRMKNSNLQRKIYSKNQTLKIVWSGMITAGKALFLLIESLKKIRNLDFELTIIGDGVLRSEMELLAKPIENKIKWVGWLDRKDVLKIISNSDLLVFTSLKEATSVTIMEALEYGLPVICHNTCGMGVVINDKNGFKIPYKNQLTSIDFISNTIASIISNPELINSKYKTIAETTHTLSWDIKIQQIAKTINQKIH